jgi:hypothetical protein
MARFINAQRRVERVREEQDKEFDVVRWGVLQPDRQ